MKPAVLASVLLVLVAATATVHAFNPAGASGASIGRADQDQQAEDNVHSTMPESKKQWPELVGKTYEEAAEVIRREASDVTLVPRVPEGAFVTMDYRLDRVRVYVNEAGNVIRAPMRG